MTDEHILDVMERYGVGPADFVRAAVCQESLESFQRRMKVRYRELAKDLHPDRGGDEHLFKAATAVYEDVMGMQVRVGPEYGRSSDRRQVKWAVHFRMEVV